MWLLIHVYVDMWKNSIWQRKGFLYIYETEFLIHIIHFSHIIILSPWYVQFKSILKSSSCIVNHSCVMYLVVCYLWLFIFTWCLSLCYLVLVILNLTLSDIITQTSFHPPITTLYASCKQIIASFLSLSSFQTQSHHLCF